MTLQIFVNVKEKSKASEKKTENDKASEQKTIFVLLKRSLNCQRQ